MFSKYLVLAVSIVSVFFNSCFTLINIKESDIKTKGDAIAVISGTNKEENLAFASNVIKELKIISRFKVLSVEEIAQKIPGYPINITGPYDTASISEIDEDYTKTDKLKLAGIQKKLGVNYLYVLWTPIATRTSQTITLSQGGMRTGGSTTKVDELHVIGQLFEYPGANEIGTSKFNIQLIDEGKGCVINIGGRSAKNFDDALQLWSERLAKEIAEKMKMEKKS